MDNDTCILPNKNHMYTLLKMWIYINNMWTFVNVNVHNL